MNEKKENIIDALIFKKLNVTIQIRPIVLYYSSDAKNKNTPLYVHNSEDCTLYLY